MSTCRFCKQYTDEVKYGTRHYAHFVCYLDSEKPLADLPLWQLGKFPHRLLVSRGLMHRVNRLMTEKQTQTDLAIAKLKGIDVVGLEDPAALHAAVAKAIGE